MDINIPPGTLSGVLIIGAISFLFSFLLEKYKNNREQKNNLDSFVFRIGLSLENIVELINLLTSEVQDKNSFSATNLNKLTFLFG